MTEDKEMHARVGAILGIEGYVDHDPPLRYIVADYPGELTYIQIDALIAALNTDDITIAPNKYGTLEIRIGVPWVGDDWKDRKGVREW